MGRKRRRSLAPPPNVPAVFMCGSVASRDDKLEALVSALRDEDTPIPVGLEGMKRGRGDCRYRRAALAKIAKPSRYHTCVPGGTQPRPHQRSFPSPSPRRAPLTASWPPTRSRRRSDAYAIKVFRELLQGHRDDATRLRHERTMALAAAMSNGQVLFFEYSEFLRRAPFQPTTCCGSLDRFIEGYVAWATRSGGRTTPCECNKAGREPVYGRYQSPLSSEMWLSIANGALASDSTVTIDSVLVQAIDEANRGYPEACLREIRRIQNIGVRGCGAALPRARGPPSSILAQGSH